MPSLTRNRDAPVEIEFSIPDVPAPEPDKPEVPTSNWESYAVLEKMRWLREGDYLDRLAREIRYE